MDLRLAEKRFIWQAARKVFEHYRVVVVRARFVFAPRAMHHHVDAVVDSTLRCFEKRVCRLAERRQKALAVIVIVVLIVRHFFDFNVNE